MNNVELGKYGEDLACKFLEKNGYKILDRNKKFSRLCELDIVAKKLEELVFVEVKTRRTESCGSPFEAITKTKFNNLKTGVMLYLQSTNLKFKRYRLDVVAITLEPKLKIEHLKNISL